MQGLIACGRTTGQKDGQSLLGLWSLLAFSNLRPLVGYEMSADLLTDLEIGYRAVDRLTGMRRGSGRLAVDTIVPYERRESRRDQARLPPSDEAATAAIVYDDRKKERKKKRTPADTNARNETL